MAFSRLLVCSVQIHMLCVYRFINYIVDVDILLTINATQYLNSVYFVNIDRKMRSLILKMDTKRVTVMLVPISQ